MTNPATAAAATSPTAQDLPALTSYGVLGRIGLAVSGASG